MESDYHHKILAVDPDKKIRETISRVLKEDGLECIVSDNGESALKEIKSAKQPFSLILSEQQIKGMSGIRFLMLVKEISPVSSRFLMAGEIQMELLIHAVNMGCIQQYIVKPWEHNNFIPAIRSGIRFHEKSLEHEKLLILAKKQNSTLFELNCELMESAKNHERLVHELDQDILALENEIKVCLSQKDAPAATLLNEIENRIKNNSIVDTEKLQALFSETIKCLHGRFDEAAQRNGIEMPQMTEDDK